ncbi:glycoside hydrolase family 130 protein [Mucilaginibacter sp. CSA2-8R]|uniref:glycoside hydrolase family 130 protein n=1 Tax=Mucilaginibacter sp. CSA2-8R TaxID=3141542 RepID=UPI00315D34E6
MIKIKTLSLILTSSFLSIAVQAQKLPDWALGPFNRPANINPIITPDTSSYFHDPMTGRRVAWEANDTFNPAATVFNEQICILYRAEDKSGVGISQRTSRIGLAKSNNGTSVIRSSAPVLFPANDAVKEFEWTGGCEDPRVAVTADGTYLALYTEWNHKVPRLAAAISKDLRKWQKHGPVFRQAYHGKFFNMGTKSASILTKLVNGKLVITKLNGKYWMYWGEDHVYAASSTDLVNWMPLIDANGNLKILAQPRKGFFDSVFTECGPPAVLTDKGIILLYNGKNDEHTGDTRYAPNAYCAGQMLFDKNNPEKVLARLDRPFLKPEQSFEKSGQYPAGTVFVEGLVYYKNAWYLYYGCADSKVAVAIWKP